MKKAVIDFETRSECNLKLCGAYKYSLDPSTRPTCLAIKIKGEPAVYFLPFEVINRKWKDLPLAFRKLWMRILDEGFLLVAHNAFFERVIYENILVARLGWPPIGERQWRCTAAKAAACALPRSLEGAGEAMRLRVQKDKRGYVAMMLTCKTTKQWNAWKKTDNDIKAGKRISDKRMKPYLLGEPPIFLEPEAAPDVWNTLYTYCKIDVRSEEALDDSLPDLIPLEQEIWFFNQKLNWRGLHMDVPVAKKVIGIMATESTEKLKELDSLTMGLVTKPGARKAILEFLALDGIILPDIKAKTVEDALKDKTVTGDMHRLLEIRKALAKTSTAKFQAILNRATGDNRIRDILMYHGASTGRDTGTGFQPHNLPRGVIKVSKDRPYAAIENVHECDSDMLKLLYGDNLSMVFSSILRNTIIPSAGCELFVADFSKIEVAVLWWLADNAPGLAILNSGKDPYKYMAAENTGLPYESIQDEGDDRQLGKAQVLGCGFQMGWKRFQSAAWDQYRLKLTKEQSKEAVKKYREANPEVPKLWKHYEHAAIKAIENPGMTVKIGKCKFFTHQKFLWIQLPSGRRLAYRNPSVAWRVREYEDEIWNERTQQFDIIMRTGEPKKTVEFWAVNSKTKQWAQERTFGGSITENIVQAVARDLMMPAMVRLEKLKYNGLLMVHDEGICERKIGEGNLKEFVKILCEKPSWADESLPLEAKGWQGMRYKK